MNRVLFSFFNPPNLDGWKGWMTASEIRRENTQLGIQTKRNVSSLIKDCVVFPIQTPNETSLVRTVNGENGQTGAIVDVRFVVRSWFQTDGERCFFLWGRTWTFVEGKTHIPV